MNNTVSSGPMLSLTGLEDYKLSDKLKDFTYEERLIVRVLYEKFVSVPGVFAADFV